MEKQLDLSNFSLIYPDLASKRDHLSGEKLPDTGNDAGSAKLSMLSLILNETLNAMIDTGQKTGLANAVKDTLGLEKSQAEYYSELGADAIFAELDRLHDKYGYGSYVHREKEIWDRYYS